MRLFIFETCILCTKVEETGGVETGKVLINLAETENGNSNSWKKIKRGIKVETERMSKRKRLARSRAQNLN